MFSNLQQKTDKKYNKEISKKNSKILLGIDRNKTFFYGQLGVWGHGS